MKRNKEIHLRMTDSELINFKNKVAETGLTQTQFVLKAIDCATISSAELTEAKLKENKLLYSFIQEINRIGVNINQISKAVNSNKADGVNVLRELQEYRTQLAELKEVINNLEVIKHSDI